MECFDAKSGSEPCVEQAAFAAYPRARFRGMSNSIDRPQGVVMSFELEGGQRVRLRLSAEDMCRLAVHAAVVCMRLDQECFEAVISGVQPLMNSQSASSLGSLSLAGLPTGGQSA